MWNGRKLTTLFWRCFIPTLGNKMRSYKKNLCHQQTPARGEGKRKRGFVGFVLVFLLDYNFMQRMMVFTLYGFTEEYSCLRRTPDNPRGLSVRT